MSGKKKDAPWRQSAFRINLLRFKAAAERRQWSSAASRPRRKSCVKLWQRFWMANVPLRKIYRSSSASRYTGWVYRSRFLRRWGMK